MKQSWAEFDALKLSFSSFPLSSVYEQLRRDQKPPNVTKSLTGIETNIKESSLVLWIFFGMREIDKMKQSRV